ncbi:MAG TPA: sugar ABC transporter permease, partial [Thermoanaerobaculia bacterium]|nr:sugar ABC transporter permease [Thermoanaerobaculia bacterium]
MSEALTTTGERGDRRGRIEAMLRRLRGGELGVLPVVAGLLIIAATFQSMAPSFLSPGNISNLTLQIVPTGLVALGLVLVLLLGEVDLSAGSVSGLCAAVMAIASVARHLDPVLAMVLAVLLGAGIGAAQGSIVARLGVPSFVVTLAGLIGWQGALLWTLGDTGTVNLPYHGAVATLANSFVRDKALAYALAALPAALYFVALLRAEGRRGRLGLPRRPPLAIALRAGGLLLLALAAAYVLCLTRGLPMALLVFVGLVAIFDLALRKTRYGRMVFAVGGNAEAARRAGID